MSEPLLTPLNTPKPVQPRASRGPWIISGIALVIAIAALLVTLRGSDGYSEEDTRVLPPSDVPALELPAPTSTPPTRSLFKPPQDLEAAIAAALASTVTLECGDSSQGTAWAIALDNPESKTGITLPDVLTKFPTRLVTNHHVISDCTNDPSDVTAYVGDEAFDAYVYSWDPTNDQAIVLTTAELTPLPLSPQPKPGWWALSVGTPQGLAGSVSIGNITNVDGVEVIATAPMNTGNSGGPLLNAAGSVMGSTTYSTVSDAGLEPWFVSEGILALCDRLVTCTPTDLGWSEGSE